MCRINGKEVEESGSSSLSSWWRDWSSRSAARRKAKRLETSPEPQWMPSRKRPEEGTTTRAVLFWLCALGYMAPWTFIGSLIALFKKRRDANFYVEIYGIYYATGMPTSMLQQRYDTYWDMKLGSVRTYLLRGQINFMIVLICVLIMPFCLIDRFPMLLLMAVLGISSWMLHGTACMLASMVSTSSISALQTGFRTPEILAIAACYYLDIGSSATPGAIRAFFLIIAALVLAGLIAWTALIFTPSARAALRAKDQESDHLDLPAADRLATEKMRKPLLATSTEEHITRPTRYKTTERRFVGDYDDETSSGIHYNEEARRAILDVATAAANADGDTDDDLPAADDDDRSDDTEISDPECPTTCQTVPPPDGSFESTLSKTEMDGVAASIWPCRVALFWTMFGSIFTAAFFAYANSTAGIDIEQVLYFTRLFGDLLGRPFTSLPRPRCLQTPRQLAIFSVLRLVLSVIFFLYVFIPGFPQSDIFIVADIGLFSVSSGYVGIVSYEMAARDFKSAAAKSYAASLMNTTFQFSMFLAVLLSIVISEILS